jgi:hypothetical protein
MGIFHMSSIWQDNADHFAQRRDPEAADRIMRADIRDALRLIRGGHLIQAHTLMMSSVREQARVGEGIGPLQLSAATRPASDGVVIPMQREHR